MMLKFCAITAAVSGFLALWALRVLRQPRPDPRNRPLGPTRRGIIDSVRNMKGHK